MAESDEPSTSDGIALALLDYRVQEVEKRVEVMGRGLIEVDRKVNDIPGFIARKFEEQAAQIAARGKSAGDEQRSKVNLVLTGIAACGGAVGAIVALWAHHP